MSFLDSIGKIASRVRASPGEVGFLALICLFVVGASVAVVARTSTGEPPPPPITAFSSPEPMAEVLVHVAGAVTRPGVYELAEGSRVQDAIAAAGGATAEADLDSLNLAALVTDGQKIHVLTKGAAASEAPLATGGKVNLNSATQAQLEELPGVGPVLAKRIIDYRARRPFKSVRQLLEVDGFGTKKFDQLKDLVTV